MYHGRCVALAVCILILLSVLSGLPSSALPRWQGTRADAKFTGSTAGVEETQSISGPTIQDFYVNTTQCSAPVQWNFTVSEPTNGLQNVTFWWNNGTTSMGNTTITYMGSPNSANALFNGTLPSTAQNVTFQCWAYNTYIYGATGVRWMLTYPSDVNYASFLNLGTAIQTVENNNNWGTTDPYLGVVLSQNNTSVLSTMIDNYATGHDWYNVLLWSAACYKLGILRQTDIKYALGNITTIYYSNYTAYLPIDSHSGAFSVQYGKALLYGYFFNNMSWGHVNDTRWNIANAYTWFNTTEYNALASYQIAETFSVSGLGVPSYTYGSRYYDDYASCIEEYIIFALLLNVSGALNDGLYVWNKLNVLLWTGSYYQYSMGQSLYECEASFFLKIASELRYYITNLDNWSNILTDIGNRFLSTEWNSFQWMSKWTGGTATTYSVVHAYDPVDTSDNTQTRLQNTLGAWQALLGCYLQLNSTYQNDMKDMLTGNTVTRPAWQLLLSNYTQCNPEHASYITALFNMTSNQFRSLSTAGVTFEPTDSNSTAEGELLMFMMGIVPGTNTVAFPLEELSYEYVYDIDPVELTFNYNSTLHQIMVPVWHQGTITFQYGCSPITYYFNQSGIWQITFTNSWNNMLNASWTGNLPDNVIYFQNIVSPPTHDVAVVDVTSSKTVIGQGYGTEIEVTVANQGTFSETFNVTAYADTTAIGTQQVSGLNAMDQTTLMFTWNTSEPAYGNYTLSAYAWPVPNETNTANNNCTEGVITLTIPGDLNGDFKVSLADLVLLANAYGSEPFDVKWNPNADMNGDGIVDRADLVILAIHYGQHYP